MRTMVMIAMMCAACEAVGGVGAEVQAVAGPSVTVSARAAGALAVGWATDPAAARYQVLRAASGGAPATVAVVFDSAGGAPATSYIDTGLTGGTSYCYAIESGYADGSTSDPGAAVCGVAGQMSPPTVRTLIVPVFPVRILSPLVAQWADVGGQGSASHWAYIPLALPVGDTIMAIRSRVEDAGSGTTLRERLLAMSDSQELFSVVAISPPSSGLGVDETLAIPGPIVTAPTTQYVLEIGNAANPANLDSKLFRVEVDVQRP